jgi:hypothetical protein
VKNSKANAAKIRAWQESDAIPAGAFRDCVKDWVARKYLTEEDGRELAGR